MQPPSIDYSRKWYVMAAVAMSIFLATVDSSIVNVALPTLVRDLNTNFPTVQWVVLGYLLTQATLMLSVGRLGDMLGKKPIYTAGFVVFTVGSVLCGLAPTIHWLIGFRMLQAIGAAMTLALGISGAIVSIGIVVGPTLGGVLIDALSWHWIFFVNLPVGIVGTLLALRFVPAFKPAGRQQFDYLGAITLFISLLSLLLALTFGQQVGFGERRILLLFANWAIFLVAFLIVEWRASQPMIDLRLFRNRWFSFGLATGMMTFVAIGGTIILLPFYLENILGFGTRQVGLLMTVVPIGMGVLAPISGTLSDRFGTHSMTLFGLCAMLIGYYAMSTLGTGISIPGYFLRLLPVGVGMGMFQSPNNSAIMGSAPRERLGIASSLLSINRVLGQITGVAVLGAVWASRVAFHVGAMPSGGATTASKVAQVAGLHDTFMTNMLLIILALALSVWGLLQERRRRQMAPLHVQSEGRIGG
jgi:EmrB/QacA subfamily drug resistance transporter